MKIRERLRLRLATKRKLAEHARHWEQEMLAARREKDALQVMVMQYREALKRVHG